MNKLLKSIDYVGVLKYTAIFFCFLLFGSIEDKPYMYSAAPFVALISSGASLILTPIIFILSFLALGHPGLLGSAAICAVISVAVVFIYRQFKQRIRFELCAYLAVSLLGFIFLGDTFSQIPTEKRILSALLTVGLCFFCFIGYGAAVQKGLKFKLGFEEFASLALLSSIMGLGVCNLLSPLVWRALSVFVLLGACYLFRPGIATLISAILGISLALYYHNVSLISVFIVWAVAAESLTSLSRYVSALSVVAADYVVQALFLIYPVYGTEEVLSILCGAVLFCLLPSKPLKRLKDKLYAFREKHLVRQTINRNRLMLAGKLYDLSSVFTEMAWAFNAFNQKESSDDAIKITMQKQIVDSSCKDCEFKFKCEEYQKELSIGISKMLDIGFAKGKLSLIDFPKDVSSVCLKPNNLLFSINKLLAEYRAYTLEKDNVKTGRNLLAQEAEGISEILRGLALESGAVLKFQNRIERALSESLFKNGIMVSELLIYGEEERISVGLIVVMKEFSLDRITSIISSVLGVNMIVYERVEITDSKCYLSFRKAAAFDAVFGLAKATKDGSETSGDTHSVTRISGDKFLVALSDGMGSGKTAESVSSASLSLIESFYKAGLSGSLILNTVNKLLSINSEDTFTALDVGVIDLKDCSADFIKYGAPYGFIIGDGGVKIIEGNALPLGILDELKPSVCHTSLNRGDMIVLITDGISDAFGSSSEIIDFLRTVPAKNPQTLSDSLLQRAIELNGGKHNDDMTALSVRVYKLEQDKSA